MIEGLSRQIIHCRRLKVFHVGRHAGCPGCPACAQVWHETTSYWWTSWVQSMAEVLQIEP
ncbi:hypothetical protein BD309DRAFT_966255 [Dichomitus squalens]|nr:hypothetical protein BD309DRAFT_966255 [Dichomitus squalens]